VTQRPRSRHVIAAGAFVVASSVGAAAVSMHHGPAPVLATIPGALNPDVTQSNVGVTICVPNWTASVRPSSGYTSSLKQQQMADLGYRDRDPSHFEEDHLVPLGAGGQPTAPSNLWPQPRGQAKRDDPLETKIQRAICAGQITLAEGQRQITDYKRRNG